MKNARTTMVSFGILAAVSIPYWLMIAMLLSERLSTLFFSVMVFLAVSFAAAWTRGDSIYRWWLSGYDEDSYQKPPRSLDSIYRNPIERNSETIESDSDAIENRNVNEKARGKTIEKPSHTIENPIESSNQTIEKTIETPSKEDLAKLKEALNIKVGFLKYKASGDKVYHVFYVPELKRQTWKALETWAELKDHLKNYVAPRSP